MKSWIVVTLILGYTIASAQMNEKSLGFNLDVGNIQLKEKALNNAKHAGILTGLGIYYEVKSQSEFIHRFGFSMAWGPLKSKYEEEKNSVFSNPGLSYSLLKILPSKVNLGGYFSTNYRVMEFENWDDSHIYWFTSYELGPIIQLNPITNFSAQLSFPIVSLVSRSRDEVTNKVDSGNFLDIFSMIHSDLSIVSINQYQSFDLQASYRLIDTEKVNFQIEIVWQFIHISLPEKKSLTYTTIIPGINLSYKLR